MFVSTEDGLWGQSPPLSKRSPYSLAGHVVTFSLRWVVWLNLSQWCEEERVPAILNYLLNNGAPYPGCSFPTCWWLGNNDAAATLKATFRIGQAIHSVLDVSFKMSFETVPQVNYIVHKPPNWNLSVSQFLNNTYFKIWFLFCDTCYPPILCHSTELF